MDLEKSFFKNSGCQRK